METAHEKLHDYQVELHHKVAGDNRSVFASTTIYNAKSAQEAVWEIVPPHSAPKGISSIPEREYEHWLDAGACVWVARRLNGINLLTTFFFIRSDLVGRGKEGGVVLENATLTTNNGVSVNRQQQPEQELNASMIAKDLLLISEKIIRRASWLVGHGGKGGIPLQAARLCTYDLRKQGSALLKIADAADKAAENQAESIPNTPSL